MEKQDKERYRLAMEHYYGRYPYRREAPRKRKKPTRDLDAPRRPLGAFLLFCNDERDNVKKRFPLASITDVTRILGQVWREKMSEDGKTKYIELAKSAMAAYKMVKIYLLLSNFISIRQMKK